MTGDADETGAHSSGWQQIASDWRTILQSEHAAWSADREPAELWAAWLGLWAAGLRNAAAFLPPPARPDAGRAAGAGAEPPARPASPVAAPDIGQPAGRDPADSARIELLAERVAELERRLAELGGPPGS